MLAGSLSIRPSYGGGGRGTQKRLILKLARRLLVSFSAVSSVVTQRSSRLLLCGEEHCVTTQRKAVEQTMVSLGRTQLPARVACSRRRDTLPGNWEHENKTCHAPIFSCRWPLTYATFLAGERAWKRRDLEKPQLNVNQNIVLSATSRGHQANSKTLKWIYK